MMSLTLTNLLITRHILQPTFLLAVMLVAVAEVGGVHVLPLPCPECFIRLKGTKTL